MNSICTVAAYRRAGWLSSFRARRGPKRTEPNARDVRMKKKVFAPFEKNKYVVQNQPDESELKEENSRLYHPSRPTIRTACKLSRNNDHPSYEVRLFLQAFDR